MAKTASKKLNFCLRYGRYRGVHFFLSCNIFTFVAKILYFVATFLVKSQKMKVVPYNALLHSENRNKKYEELTEIMSKMYVKMVKF